VIYAILLNCENGHNIVATAHDDHGKTPTPAECEELCKDLERAMAADMRAGKLPRECPHCGSKYNREWTIEITRTPEVATIGEMDAFMREAADAGQKEALAAIGRRAMAVRSN
jgi:hypothetical protein